ncbi:TetR/AcrR family transcriptional regulator [Paraeggerthella hongkongensis]|uniref:TetR/AcrR family transcriptional regulator n=1 Tax=Paraeggerthella hongkongensis TaxID=230658 RepID=A0A3N0AT15_9ACTN|nr:TetR/AcrR family transcriptional regulator [Paraeggerthella hongkongensis]RNL37804.1 TetR/AcrR family transcriptional regulator [Paraeggerthella hongkongensis]
MENQRVRLSKALLKEALVRLLESKPIDKITIYELCAEAQINRTTFYKYYGSQQDVLRDIENELFSMLEKHLAESVEGDEQSFVSVLRYLDMEQRKFLALVNATPDQQFSERLFNIEPVRAYFASSAFGEGDDSEKEYLRLFLCQGGYAIVREWLNKTPHESPQEISNLLIKLSLLFVRKDWR